MASPFKLKPRHREGASDTHASSFEIGNDFVSEVYDRLSKVYDLVFGPTLQHGRIRAIARMELKPDDKVLEVGVGTGLNVLLYPPTIEVTGIDFSASMLEKARERVAREGRTDIRLLEMDAADLKFPDDSFDVVYAPYLVSVVPDPVKAVREMYRVCRPGGRIVILNHFKSPHRLLSRLEELITPLTVHIGFKSDLDLPLLLKQAELEPTSIEMVNFPRWWSLVTCVKPAG